MKKFVFAFAMVLLLGASGYVSTTGYAELPSVHSQELPSVHSQELPSVHTLELPSVH